MIIRFLEGLILQTLVVVAVIPVGNIFSPSIALIMLDFPLLVSPKKKKIVTKTNQIKTQVELTTKIKKTFNERMQKMHAFCLKYKMKYCFHYRF